MSDSPPVSDGVAPGEGTAPPESPLGDGPVRPETLITESYVLGAGGEHQRPGQHVWFCPRCRNVREPGLVRCPDDGVRLVENLAGVVLADRYELQKLIGVGGMGSTVWRAWQLSTQRPVAVKLLPPIDEQTRARFSREAIILSSLNHPHITTIHDFGATEDARAFLVMELLRGAPLRRIMRRQGRLPVRRALRVADQVLRGLEHAHGRGVVHRDLKSGNLFLTSGEDQTDFVKVLDFGIAEFVTGDRPAPGNGSSGGKGPEIAGTPYYMAPEQLTSSRIDARTDLYALGIVLYAMLAGRVPFHAGERDKLFRAILTEPPPSFAEVCPEADIPAPIEDFVRRALAKAPEDRYESARAMRAELRAVRHGVGLYLEDTEEGFPALDAAESTDAPGANAAVALAAEEQVSRRWGLWTLAALIPAIALALWGWWPSGDPTADGPSPRSGARQAPAAAAGAPDSGMEAAVSVSAGAPDVVAPAAALAADTVVSDVGGVDAAVDVATDGSADVSDGPGPEPDVAGEGGAVDGGGEPLEALPDVAPARAEPVAREPRSRPTRRVRSTASPKGERAPTPAPPTAPAQPTAVDSPAAAEPVPDMPAVDTPPAKKAPRRARVELLGGDSEGAAVGGMGPKARPAGDSGSAETPPGRKPKVDLLEE